MGRRGLLAMVVAAAMAAALMVGLSQAPASTAPQQEQADASCWTDYMNRGFPFADGERAAIAFTARNTGRLTGVEVPIAVPGDAGSLIAEIRTASRLPTDTVLASTSVSASRVPERGSTTVRIDFDPGVNVVTGQQYAIVLGTSGTSEGFIWYGEYEDIDQCPGSRPYRETPDYPPYWSGLDDEEIFFRAFVASSGSNSGPAECTIEGTNHSEILRGTNNSDVICGFGGDDILIGERGRDVLRGGAGSDALDTEDFVRGNDTADGGNGNDTCDTDRRDRRISC